MSYLHQPEEHVSLTMGPTNHEMIMMPLCKRLKENNNSNRTTIAHPVVFVEQKV